MPKRRHCPARVHLHPPNPRDPTTDQVSHRALCRVRLMPVATHIRRWLRRCLDENRATLTHVAPREAIFAWAADNSSGS